MTAHAWQDATLPLTDRVTAALAHLTRDQLIALALADYTVLAGLGLPALSYRDGPSGVRDIDGGTAMPVTLALAATMDTDLAYAYGAALGAEVRASGHTVLLGPAVDITRSPLGGRAAETLGEDPWLAGHLGRAHVRGVQSRHVIAMVKHLVGNTHERGRTGDGPVFSRGDAVDVRIDERTLHEIYLAPFRTVLAEGGAWAVMASYNRLNGRYPAQSPDLLDLVKAGWPGFVAPDFIFAVRDALAATRAGLDVPGLDGPSGRTADMFTSGDVPDARLHDIAARILTALIGVGLADPQPPAPVDIAAHDALAAQVAAEAMTLLANPQGLLPLPDDVDSIALIGPAGDDAIYTVGGSGGVNPDPARTVTPLAGITARARQARVTHAQGSLGDIALPSVPARVFSQPDGASGVLAEYTSGDGPTRAHIEPAVDRSGPPDGIDGDWRARWTARLTPRASGVHRFSLSGGGDCVLRVNGRDLTAGVHEAQRMFAGPGYARQGVVTLAAGVPVDVEVDFTHGPALDLPFLGIRPGVRLGWQEPDDLITAAAATAAQARVAVVIVQQAAGEAMDRTDLNLPGDQNALIAAIAAANPNTIVVLNTPGPVLMPWHDDVAAIVQAWHPGQRFGDALAAVLFGDTDPGGRLPVTFPADADQGPLTSLRQFPGQDGVVEHSERLLVGYRHYDHTGRKPLHPFGHGMSYADFRYEDLRLRRGAGGFTADVSITNVADRPGTETVQLYVTPPPSAAGPQLRALKGVAKVRLAAGQTTTICLRVPDEDLAAYQPDAGWQLTGGAYRVDIGRSSADLRLHADYHPTTSDAEHGLQQKGMS
jgi:beta-glucosidase